MGPRAMTSLFSLILFPLSCQLCHKKEQFIETCCNRGCDMALVVGLSSPRGQQTDIRFTLGWKPKARTRLFPAGCSARVYFAEEGLNVTSDQGEGSGRAVTRSWLGPMTRVLGDINAIIQNAAQRPGEAPVMVYQLWNRRRLRLCRRNPRYRKTCRF